MDALLDRPAWYVLGPLIGLVVLGLYATINERFGVLGGYSAVIERATGRIPDIGWKGWLLIGVLTGSLVYRLAAGESTVGDGYGWLTREFSDVPTAALLIGAGALIGFGAKTAGGCTSGNGLGACSAGATSGIAATATFIATGVVCSFFIQAVT